MAAKRRASGNVTLPWEPRTGLVRDVLSGRRIRLVPVALLVLLLGYGVVVSSLRREAIQSTRDTIDTVHRAIAHFRADMGRCPSSMHELVHPPRTGARYLEDAPVDAWGHPLWVRCPGRYDADGDDVLSAGPSGNFLIDDNVW
jgi:hypothetical protein